MRAAEQAPERVFVGLGANLGDPQATLDAALAAIATLPQIELIRVSPRYRTAPIEAGGRDFINAVAELRTSLDPAALLAALHGIEHQHGRERPYRNAPRTLDLDLLMFGQRMLKTKATDGLTVPHPRLHQRAFVLRPLLDLAPDLVHPRLGELAPWLANVADQRVERLG
jgi:2-amino-4-hydroxy-6-hydroxymethyldihydropteridine diphosphokinase